MKIDIVKLSDLADYFKIERLKTELNMKLLQIHRNTERNLVLTKELKPLCESLQILKDRHKIKLDDDLVKAIKRNLKR